MDAVPIYNVNPASQASGFNGWEAMALLNGAGRGNSNGFDGGNGCWAWILLLLLFGWGGFGGFGGGWGGGRFPVQNNGTADTLGMDLAISNAANTAELKGSANYNIQSNAQQITLIGQLKDMIASGFSNAQNALTQNGYTTQLGQRDILAQISNCCCQTQQGIANVNYNLATTGAGITNAINSNCAAINSNLTQQIAQLNYNNAMQTCEIKQAIAAEGQATRQLLQTEYTKDLERKLSEVNQQLFVLEKFGQYANGNGCNCGNSCGC